MMIDFDHTLINNMARRFGRHKVRTDSAGPGFLSLIHLISFGQAKRKNHDIRSLPVVSFQFEIHLQPRLPQ